MESTEQETVRVCVSFSGMRLAGPGLRDLNRGQAPSVNILRARITPDGASFELVVIGRRSRIEEFFQRVAGWGGSVGAFSVGVAPIGGHNGRSHITPSLDPEGACQPSRDLPRVNCGNR